MSSKSPEHSSPDPTSHSADDEPAYFTCRLCPKTFATMGDVRRHHRKEHGGIFPKKFCPYATLEKCKHKSDKADNMANHIRTHTKEKPYGCPLCSSVFSDPSSRNRHIKTYCKRKHSESLTSALARAILKGASHAPSKPSAHNKPTPSHTIPTTVPPQFSQSRHHTTCPALLPPYVTSTAMSQSSLSGPVMDPSLLTAARARNCMPFDPDALPGFSPPSSTAPGVNVVQSLSGNAPYTFPYSFVASTLYDQMFLMPGNDALQIARPQCSHPNFIARSVSGHNHSIIPAVLQHTVTLRSPEFPSLKICISFHPSSSPRWCWQS